MMHFQCLTKATASCRFETTNLRFCNLFKPVVPSSMHIQKHVLLKDRLSEWQQKLNFYEMSDFPIFKLSRPFILQQFPFLSLCFVDVLCTTLSSTCFSWLRLGIRVLATLRYWYDIMLYYINITVVASLIRVLNVSRRFCITGSKLHASSTDAHAIVRLCHDCDICCQCTRTNHSAWRAADRQVSFMW
jgi:hypothetical protein